MTLRAHAAYGAFVLHRISGIALALFIPVHLYVLSGAIDQGQELDQFLNWADRPTLKVAEAILVALLAAHLLGGLRLLALELIGWQGRVAVLFVGGLGASVVVGLLYLIVAG